MKGTGDGLNLRRLVLVVVLGDLGGLGVFTDHHVDANFRTVNLMCFFFKLLYFELTNCRIQVFFVFDNISVQLRSLQTKLL